MVVSCGVYRSLWLRVFVISATIQVGTSSASPGCVFPEFLQTENGLEQRREWRIRLQEIDVTVTVDGAVMRSSVEETTRRNRDVKHNPITRRHRRRQIGQRRQRSNNDYQTRFSYVRECVTSVSVPVGDNSLYVTRYFVTHRTPLDSDVSYLCVEFVIRSESFVQVRESAITSTRNSSVCFERPMLGWNPWPLVDISRFFTSLVRCPIHGGFNIRLYDRRRRYGLCDAYDGETRIESECSSSSVTSASDVTATEGLVFRFRYESCIPVGLHMSVIQRTFCAASWTADNDGALVGAERTTFIVLRHDRFDEAWCFRYNWRSMVDDVPLDQFSALLFVGGLHCDVGSVGTNTTTTDYIKIDLSRDADDLHRQYRQSVVNESLGFPDRLCIDDYEACSFWKEACELETASSMMKLTCAKSCGQCVPGQRPTGCPSGLPMSYHGSWSENSDPRNSRITISRDQVLFGGGRVFRCVRWDVGIPVQQNLNFSLDDRSPGQSHQVTVGLATWQRPDRERRADTWEQLFVTESPGTGCRPRYACIQFKRRSHSVMYFRVTQSEIWPPPIGFKLQSAADFNCNLLRYRDDVIYNTVHSKNLKLIIRQDKRNTVHCRLPRTVDFEVYYETPLEGTCHGRLTVKHPDNDTLLYTLEDNCRQTDAKHEEFRCLDSTLNENDESDWLIISELITTPDDVPRRISSALIVCWLFAEYSAQRGNVIYRISAQDCNLPLGPRINAGTLQPEVTLAEIDRGDETVVGWYPTSTTTSPPTTPEGCALTSATTSRDEDCVKNSTEIVEAQDWNFLEGQEILSIFDEPGYVPLGEGVDNNVSSIRYTIVSHERRLKWYHYVFGSGNQRVAADYEKTVITVLVLIAFFTLL